MYIFGWPRWGAHDAPHTPQSDGEGDTQTLDLGAFEGASPWAPSLSLQHAATLTTACSYKPRWYKPTWPAHRVVQTTRYDIPRPRCTSSRTDQRLQCIALAVSSQCQAVRRPSQCHRSVGVPARRNADQCHVGHARYRLPVWTIVSLNLNECDGTVTLLHCMIKMRLSIRNCSLCVFYSIYSRCSKTGHIASWQTIHQDAGQTVWKTGRSGENGTGGNPNLVLQWS